MVTREKLNQSKFWKTEVIVLYSSGHEIVGTSLPVMVECPSKVKPQKLIIQVIKSQYFFAPGKEYQELFLESVLVGLLVLCLHWKLDSVSAV